ncbi:MAG: 4-alpha-glucanotransferase [Candidatus Kariarchaeaceae archaeon]|jgi:4-alpha-glucanotransferase
MGRFKKGCGILLHPTSFPSDYGIGDFGSPIFSFIDILYERGMKYWQILPLGPTGYGDSPYQSFSSFAGNPLLISIDLLIEDGLLQPDDIPPSNFSRKKVEFGKVIPFKERLFRIAYERFLEIGDLSVFEQFIQEENDWLHDFSLFSALKSEFDLRPWYEWSAEYQAPDAEGSVNFVKDNKGEVEFVKFVQFQFFRQWSKIKKYAESKDITIIGDLPIFVAHDSADCWANQQLFLMNDNRELTYVAGVPPDYFSETGQLWGNPLYNWDACQRENYNFWVKRMRNSLKLVHIVRIDHFRAFDSYWQVNAGAATAMEGRWVKGPGSEFFNSLLDQLGDLPLIAEDLGAISDSVVKLRDEFEMPGMAILQYAFSSTKDPSNKYLPENQMKNSVVYPGTHDNDTTLGWFASSSRSIKEHFMEYTQSDGEDIISDMFKIAFSSPADIVILTLQDILRKKSHARMNFPGRAFGNWQWRFEMDEIKEEWLLEIQELMISSGRN